MTIARQRHALSSVGRFLVGVSGDFVALTFCRIFENVARCTFMLSLQARQLEATAKEKGVEIVLPTDVVIADAFAADANTQVSWRCG